MLPLRPYIAYPASDDDDERLIVVTSSSSVSVIGFRQSHDSDVETPSSLGDKSFPLHRSNLDGRQMFFPCILVDGLGRV